MISVDINKAFKDYNDFIYYATINFPKAKLSSFDDRTVRVALIQLKKDSIRKENYEWPISLYYEEKRRVTPYSNHIYKASLYSIAHPIEKKLFHPYLMVEPFDVLHSLFFVTLLQPVFGIWHRYNNRSQIW